MKPSYADMVKSQKGVLSEANATPLGPQMKVVSGANAIPLGSNSSSRSSVHAARQTSFGVHSSIKELVPGRKSVFHRISFPRRSVFERLRWVRARPDRHSSNAGNLECDSGKQSEQPAVHPQAPPPEDSNLDLNLHLGRPTFGPLNEQPNGRASPTVRCRRCLSSSHTRHECTFQIKCNACFGWGHVAVSCQQQWERLQTASAGRVLDSFASIHSGDFDPSAWFKPASMTPGPSSPPRFTCFGETRGAAPHSFTINWPSSTRVVKSNVHPAAQENTNSAATPSAELHLNESTHQQQMAYQRVNPAVFVPHGLAPIEVQGRRVMSRLVVLRPRAKNQDLAIVSIEPLPEHQVTFNAIRGVVTDFLNQEARVVFTEILPTHLGQGFVRFKNAYDRDQLIARGLIQFGDVTLTFVEHRKGRNWRAVNFNRECWLLLLGFPPDYREDEFVANAISPFGRVMYWIDNTAHLTKLLVRTRVIDYESVPQFVVMTEGEGFQGESCTVQCENL